MSWYRVYASCRRVYQGLLKLRDASVKNKEQESSYAKVPRKKREVSKLVTHIALGNEIKVQGNIAMGSYNRRFIILNIGCAVPNESKEATKKVFKEQLQARQMWTKPNVVLNHVQEDASIRAFTNPFKLIQGPPGNPRFKAILIVANIFYL